MRYEGIQSNFAFRDFTPENLKKEAEALISVSQHSRVLIQDFVFSIISGKKLVMSTLRFIEISRFNILKIRLNIYYYRRPNKCMIGLGLLIKAR